MRVDLTLPLSGDRDTQGVYFRLYTELGGLLQSPKRHGAKKDQNPMFNARRTLGLVTEVEP